MERLKPLLPWLRWGTVVLLLGLLALDLAFPPQLPGARDTSTLVVAADASPLRAFADADGVWRHPASRDSISPLYIEALLAYEDRWFDRHPGVNPVALLRAGWQWLRGGGIVSVITALVVTFYYLLEKRLLRGLILDSLSPRMRDRVDGLWTEVENKVGRWMRGQLLLCLIIGVFATVFYGIIGLDFWPLLGLWAGITEIIPILGPWLGAIPAVLVALTMGAEIALLVAVFILLLQSLENWVLVPRVMRGAVGLTPLTVFVAIIAGTQLMGITGAILAIPIAAGLQVILTEYMNQRRSRYQIEPVQGSGWRWMLNRARDRDSLGSSG